MNDPSSVTGWSAQQRSENELALRPPPTLARGMTIGLPDPIDARAGVQLVVQPRKRPLGHRCSTASIFLSQS